MEVQRSVRKGLKFFSVRVRTVRGKVRLIWMKIDERHDFADFFVYLNIWLRLYFILLYISI